MSNKYLKRIVKAFLVSFIFVVLFDLLFHIFFTPKNETLFYFILKFFISFGLAYWLFSMKKIKAWKIILFGFFQAGLISIYYRYYEFVNKLGYLGRTPIIEFGNLVIQDKLPLILLWTVVHGGGWVVAFIIVHFSLKKWR